MEKVHEIECLLVIRRHFRCLGIKWPMDLPDILDDFRRSFLIFVLERLKRVRCRKNASKCIFRVRVVLPNTNFDLNPYLPQELNKVLSFQCYRIKALGFLSHFFSVSKTYPERYLASYVAINNSNDTVRKKP